MICEICKEEIIEGRPYSELHHWTSGEKVMISEHTATEDPKWGFQYILENHIFHTKCYKEKMEKYESMNGILTERTRKLL